MLTRVGFGCDFADKNIVPILRWCYQALALIKGDLGRICMIGPDKRRRMR